jgi:hypothetical protein
MIWAKLNEFLFKFKALLETYQCTFLENDSIPRIPLNGS